MVLCPTDMEECVRAACRSGYCEATRERCIVACSDCGELFDGSFAWRLCVGCTARYRVPHKEKE